MQTSWKFLVALMAGFGLALGMSAAAFYLNLGVPSDLSSWAYEIIQKKRVLAGQTASPKLLLVGGSATLFGISAKEIQDQTGVRTINFASHAALGPTYILRQAQVAAKPGDTVLLVPEYELYTCGKLDPSWADKILLDYIVARDPDFFCSLSPVEQWNLFMLTPDRRLVRGLKTRWRTLRPRKDSGVYDVRFVNECGDQSHHTVGVRPLQRDGILRTKSILGYGLQEHPQGFPVIESFCKWAKANHVRVLATFPNLCDRPDYHAPAAQQAAKKIREFFASIDVPVIGDYADSLLPLDQFFDTQYHLTEESALARTRRLIPLLEPYLKQEAVTGAVSRPAPGGTDQGEWVK